MGIGRAAVGQSYLALRRNLMNFERLAIVHVSLTCVLLHMPQMGGVLSHRPMDELNESLAASNGCIAPQR